MKNMKKQYVKPELYFENFELSANIATLCGIGVGHAEVSCRYTVAGGRTIFTETNCDASATSPDGEDTYCYHNPDDSSRLFAS